MKLIDFIKKALKEKGIDEKYADRIQKTFNLEKEEDVAGAIDLFKDNILPAITEAETSAKTIAEEAAKKAAIEAYEKEHGLKGGKPIETPAPDEDKFKGLDPSVKALLEAQSKQMEEMKTLIDGNQKAVADVQKRTVASGLLKTEELPEAWIDRVKLDSEITIEDQVKALGEEYVSIRQSAIDGIVAAGGYAPPIPTSGKDASFDSYLESRGKEQNSGFAAKEL